MSAARDFASKTVIVISSGFTASLRTLLAWSCLFGAAPSRGFSVYLGIMNPQYFPVEFY